LFVRHRSGSVLGKFSGSLRQRHSSTLHSACMQWSCDIKNRNSNGAVRSARQPLPSVHS
jgi:hypothetical protein